MAELRDLWPKSFAVFPSFRCPRCSTGIMELVGDTLKSRPTAASRLDMEALQTSYEPMLDVRRFVAILECDRAACRECVVVCGEAYEEPWQASDGSLESTTMYEPCAMFPGPPLVTIPVGTPEPVVQALRQSFSLFWGDLGATANKLRSAAERILDDQGVRQYNRTGKRTPLPFSTRIDIYSKSNSDHKEVLTALRWIGNQGSHSGKIDRDDLLTAFELVQLGLQDLYGRDYRKTLAKKGRDIVARKGRPKRKPATIN